MRRVAAVLLLAALCACGVQPQDDAEPVPAEQLPPELRTGPAPVDSGAAVEGPVTRAEHASVGPAS